MTTRKKSFESRLLAAITLALACLGCTLSIAQTPWQSPLYQDHTLVGKIWLSGENRFVSRDELLTRLQQSPLLLLGEKHDNPDHHRLRLALLNDLLLPGDSSLLVMEMMQRTQQPHIDARVAKGLPVDEATLATDLAWDSEGWPWQFYGPVITLTLQRGAGLRAGNINSSDVMQIYRDNNPRTARILDREQMAQLERDIDSSHCGMLPPGQVPAMVQVQQARDQEMADALTTDIENFDRAILLAGNFHIRHDLGVPNYLGEDTRPRLISVAFLEVDSEHEDPETYLQRFREENAYDVIWFTPALRQDDYCADMRASQAQ